MRQLQVKPKHILLLIYDTIMYNIIDWEIFIGNDN